MLTFGTWTDWEKESVIIKQGFVIQPNGRVYSKEQQKFVDMYRETHSQWFRKDESKELYSNYNDNLHAYITFSIGYENNTNNTRAGGGYWLTKEEYEKLDKMTEEYAREQEKYGIFSYTTYKRLALDNEELIRKIIPVELEKEIMRTHCI